MPDIPISISDIVTCSICPMQVYLAKSEEEYPEKLSYTVAKQISYHLGAELDEEEILDELKLVAPDIIDEAKPVLKELLSECRKHKWRVAEENDCLVRSDKYNIFGRVDRRFSEGFAIIKAGRAPEHGIYYANRVQATCYAICLDELFGRNMHPSVEYLGSGETRNLSITASDKRTFLELLKTMEKIQRGEIPLTKRGAACEHCRFKETCAQTEQPKSLLDKLRG